MLFARLKGTPVSYERKLPFTGYDPENKLIHCRGVESASLL